MGWGFEGGLRAVEDEEEVVTTQGIDTTHILGATYGTGVQLRPDRRDLVGGMLELHCTVGNSANGHLGRWTWRPS